MIDADELRDRSLHPQSLLNPEGIPGRPIALLPTNGLSVRTAIPEVLLAWKQFEMPKCPKHLLPSSHKGCKNWQAATWEGKPVFRATTMQGLRGDLPRGGSATLSRFVFFVPDGFPLKEAPIEEQCRYWEEACPERSRRA